MYHHDKMAVRKMIIKDTSAEIVVTMRKTLLEAGVKSILIKLQITWLHFVLLNEKENL